MNNRKYLNAIRPNPIGIIMAVTHAGTLKNAVVPYSYSDATNRYACQDISEQTAIENT